MKHQEGQQAIDFQVKDIYGTPISLADYAGRKLMISFYRYASCPLCNLRVHELIQRFPAFEAKGLSMLAFFQSPAERIREYVGKQDAPFPIIADPSHAVYQRYGVTSSWLGFGKAFALKLPMVFHAVIGEGFWPGKMDGDKATLPADFLITPEQTIYRAFYGSDIGDHLPIEEIYSFLEIEPSFLQSENMGAW
ncbi:peroxiredoxin-like family protein [Sulfurirhabdus autotrophica]|uniref:thioredoxin-dependent peroxiredoxin n=1 Tax=Sulfurirhabdus autotrophica TaxID=1706046 RepID=A0A4R3XXG8_9PROT|nr:peroxiredoxin-like family protein [Sulfurirhabdus autotrophica]TCV82313.1 peroxiredoxin [Sulfurirhabdus autotrophica]